MNSTNEKKKPSEDDANVNLSEFLLQESPLKKRSYEDMIDENDYNIVEVLDNSESEISTSLNCKVEKNGSSSSYKQCKSQQKEEEYEQCMI
jgi:hypothetical protein